MNREHYGSMGYCHLVAAHCMNARCAALAIHADKTWSSTSTDSTNKTSGNPTCVKLAFVRNTAWPKKYVKGVLSIDHSIAVYVRDVHRFPDVDDDAVKAAWWVMNLKGFAWDMFTTGDLPFRKLELR